MEIRQRQQNDVTIIELSGRLTVTDQPGQLKDAVAATLGAGIKRVLLDLSGVKYIDSTRLGELIAAHISCTRHGASLRLIGVPDRIMELLEMAGLDGVFVRHATIDEGLKAL